jgi:hypothetical protein
MLVLQIMTTDSRTQWKEEVAADEEVRFKGYAEEIRAMQSQAAGGGKPGRAFHLKAHTGVAAELRVREDLPEELRVGLFAKGGISKCFVRFSNGLGRRQKDGVPDVRGVAVKVLEVPGTKLIHGLENATTQDFLLITSPNFPIGSPDDFMKLVRVAQKGPLALLPGLIGAFGWSRAFRLLKDLVFRPQPSSMATAHFYTAAPTRLGPFAAKFSLAPMAQGGNMASGPDGYRDDLVKRLREGDITFKFRAQLFIDAQRTPIEDAAVEWSETASPWIELATLVLPKTDVTMGEGAVTEKAVEEMSFDPWHCTEEMRPLGAVMRARKFAYGASVVGRNASAEPGTTS